MSTREKVSQDASTTMYKMFLDVQRCTNCTSSTSIHWHFRNRHSKQVRGSTEISVDPIFGWPNIGWLDIWWTVYRLTWYSVDRISVDPIPNIRLTEYRLTRYSVWPNIGWPNIRLTEYRLTKYSIDRISGWPNIRLTEYRLTRYSIDWISVDQIFGRPNIGWPDRCRVRKNRQQKASFTNQKLNQSTFDYYRVQLLPSMRVPKKMRPIRENSQRICDQSERFSIESATNQRGLL